MTNDYIKRSDAQDMLHLYAVTVDKTDTLSSVLRNIIRDIPPADVQPAWRSTETDTPKIGEPVLIARKIRHNETVLVEPAVLRPDGTWKAIGHKIKPSSVRHWMPMPEPPKEGIE